MRLRKTFIVAAVVVAGSVGVADAAMAAKPTRRAREWEGYSLSTFEFMCGYRGGESIGSLDANDNGEIECFLPDGTRVSCEVEGGSVVYCKSTYRQVPSGSSFVPADEYTGPDTLTSGTYTSGIGTSPRQVLSGPAATRS